jgi:tRNA/rRNA methyltransferase
MEISFVLVSPAVPENIGAAARAINTMGFSKLVLVNPCDHLSDKALMLAHGSHDILRNARLINNFDEIRAEFDFLIGTSAKQRSVKADYYTVSEALSNLKEKRNTIQKVAFVFGREESGLNNEELGSCDIISYIPLNKSYPSLNLGQAVMLYAYEAASNFRNYSNIEANAEIPGSHSFRVLKANIEKQLAFLGFKSDTPIYNRIMERIAKFDSTDINLLHSILAKVKGNGKDE